MDKKKNPEPYEYVFTGTLAILILLHFLIPQINLDFFRILLLAMVFTGVTMVHYLLKKLEE